MEKVEIGRGRGSPYKEIKGWQPLNIQKCPYAQVLTLEHRSEESLKHKNREQWNSEEKNKTWDRLCTKEKISQKLSPISSEKEDIALIKWDAWNKKKFLKIKNITTEM